MKEIIGPVAKTRMLIKRPVSELFEAFVDPDKINKFWLSKASAKLELGKTIQWDFLVKGATSKVTVKKFEENKVIDIKWEDGSTSELRFIELEKEKSVIDIRTYGFEGSEDERLGHAIDNTSGFTFVVCDLKAYLERGEAINICRDKGELLMSER